MFAQIGVLNFGSFIPSLRNILHQVFSLSRSFIQYVFLAASAAACSARGAGWGGKTTRPRSTSTKRRKHMKRDLFTRPYKQIIFWLVAFLLVLAFFRVRPPEIGQSNHQLGGVFSIANSAAGTQDIKRLALLADFLSLFEMTCLLGAVCSFIYSFSKWICGPLAGFVYPLLSWLHPPTLKYTHAVSLSSREREILLHYSRSLNPSSGIQTLGT